MTKKKVLIASLAMLVLVVGITAAWAVNQDVRGNALGFTGGSGAPSPGTLWVRYYRPGFATANPAPITCPTGLVDLGGNQRFCQGAWKAFNGGFQGHVENLFNFGDAPSGTRMFATYGLELNSGQPSHIGFYAWNSEIVNFGDTTQWFQPTCSGTTNPIGCPGHATLTDSAGTDQTQVPNGPIAPLGSMRPIPVPRVTSVTPSVSPTTINLTWSAASPGTGATGTPSYILWWAQDSAGDNACNPPTEAQLTNQVNSVPIAGTSAAVDVVTDLGLSAGSEDCVTFALQIEYINLGGNASTAVRSRYLSANSQPVYLGSGGLAADIVDLRAKAIGASRDGLRVQVSWRTSLEDGVQGFYVARAESADGTFVRVSDLIPADGQPSDYDYLDVVDRVRRRGASGVFYRIETLDIDDNVSLAGPVSVTLPEADAKSGARPMRRR